MTWEGRSAGWLSRTSDGVLGQLEEPRASDTGSQGWRKRKGRQVGAPGELPELAPSGLSREPPAGRGGRPTVPAGGKVLQGNAAELFAGINRVREPGLSPLQFSRLALPAGAPAVRVFRESGLRGARGRGARGRGTAPRRSCF